MTLDFTTKTGEVSTVGRFVLAVLEAKAEEYALFGIRGDGKTIGILGAILAHAEKHRQAGFALPVPWLALRDSFANHKLTTIESLGKPLWRGRWRLYDNHHIAAFKQGAGKDDLVVLKLAGCDNLDAINKLRQEVVGVWVQEAAPVEESGGVSETAYGVANSSKGRIPTYHSPTLLDLNYPDQDHWTWRRFVEAPEPGTLALRIPPRENKHVDPRYWQKMELNLASRPDLKRRLLDGQPGTIMRGPQVADGFNHDVHIASERLAPIKDEPLLLGQDFGHTPATIIGQPYRGAVRVYAALVCEHGGVKQHFEASVIPWLAMNAPWALAAPPYQRALIRGIYDPAGNTEEETDIDQSPIRAIERMLGGLWTEGGTSWESRKGPLLALLNRSVNGRHALQIDRAGDGCRALIAALDGRWHYPMDRLGAVRRDLPEKPDHPWEDLGDAFCYFATGVTAAELPLGPLTVETEFDIFGRQENEKIKVESDFKL